MKESPAIFIKPTAHTSRRNRNRMREHGREGFVDAGRGSIISMDGIAYADLGRTLFDSVQHPTCGFWIDNNEWEIADNGTTN
jgi:hypothetical protein